MVKTENGVILTREEFKKIAVNVISDVTDEYEKETAAKGMLLFALTLNAAHVGKMIENTIFGED